MRAAKETVPRLCAHLASSEPGVTPFALCDTLDFYDGSVIASVRCTACGSLALLRVVDFSNAACLFAVRAVSAPALAQYARDAASREDGEGVGAESERFHERLDRLFSTAGAPERLIACGSAHDLDLIAAMPWPADGGRVDSRWDESFPGPDDDAWFARLGLDKWASR